jgi:hypothetical protein
VKGKVSRTAFSKTLITTMSLTPTFAEIDLKGLAHRLLEPQGLYVVRYSASTAVTTPESARKYLRLVRRSETLVYNASNYQPHQHGHRRLLPFPGTKLRALAGLGAMIESMYLRFLHPRQHLLVHLHTYSPTHTRHAGPPLFRFVCRLLPRC